jgi:hypothetical protein
MADIKIVSDSGKFKAGADSDLEVYSDGSHSYIKNTVNDQTIILSTKTGGSNTSGVTLDGSNNVTLLGNIIMGDDTSIGIADDAERIEFDGAGDISVLGANLGVGTTSPGSTFASFSGGGSDGILEIAGVSSHGILGLSKTTTADNDDVGVIAFCNTGNSNGGAGTRPAIAGIAAFTETDDSNAGADSGGHLTFWTKAGGTDSVQTEWTEKMRITDAGSVGIGTASPGDYSTSADNLVIYDANHAGITIASPTDKSGSLFFADGTSGDSEYEGFIQYDHGNNVTDAMMFGTAGTEKIRILSSGNVGINQTVPTAKLNVQNTTDAATALKVESATANLAGGDILLHLDFANNTPNPDDDGYFIKAEDKHETKYLLRSDGNAYFRGQITQESIHGTHPFLKLRVDHHSDNTGTYKTVAGMKGNITNYGSTDLYSSLELYNVSASTEQLCLTINAAREAIFYGTIKANATTLNISTGTTSTGGDINFLAGSGTRLSVNGGGAIFFNAYTTAGGALQTNQNGEIEYASSDSRLKTKTKDISDGLALVNQLKPKYFAWKLDEDIDSEINIETSHLARNEVENIGFFAQEVSSVIPEASKGGDKDELWQNYDNRAVIAVMAKAIQELSAKVTALENA